MFAVLSFLKVKIRVSFPKLYFFCIFRNSMQTAKLAETMAEIMAEKLTEHRQNTDRFARMAGKRTSGTDFAPEQVE